MDIPTVKDQVAASKPEQKEAPPPPAKSPEVLLKETVAKCVAKITPQVYTVTQTFNIPVQDEVISSLLSAGYDVDYSCVYTNKSQIKSTLKITNPVFKSQKEEEVRRNRKEVGDTMGQLFRTISANARPEDKQYYDLFGAFMEGC